jgi:transcriptional regulator with XRE-family HTH domain
MSFGNWFERFQEERKRLRHSMDSFAVALGVSKSSISKYEAGKTEPSHSTLEAAAHAGADVLYLVTGQRLAEATADSIDWEMMRQIANGVETWANNMNLHISVDKKVELMKVLYKRFAESKVVSDSAIEETVRLIA